MTILYRIIEGVDPLPFATSPLPPKEALADCVEFEDGDMSRMWESKTHPGRWYYDNADNKPVLAAFPA